MDFFSVGVFSSRTKMMKETIVDFSVMFTFVDVKNGGVHTLDFFSVGLFSIELFSVRLLFRPRIDIPFFDTDLIVNNFTY